MQIILCNINHISELCLPASSVSTSNIYKTHATLVSMSNAQDVYLSCLQMDYASPISGRECDGLCWEQIIWTSPLGLNVLHSLLYRELNLCKGT